mgnify:CR=1 FL=1
MNIESLSHLIIHEKFQKFLTFQTTMILHLLLLTLKFAPTFCNGNITLAKSLFDKLLSPSITFCPAPAWKSPGPFKNSGEFSNNTYSWEEIFHPQTLKVLKNESLYNVTQTYASYYGLCFTMQKLTPERVSDYSFQIVVNNTVDYIYYLHEPYMNTYS